MGLGIFAIALTLRLSFFPLASGLPYLTFYPGVALSLLLCGPGPSALVTALFAATAYIGLFAPYWSFKYSEEGLLGTVVFLVTALIFGAVTQALRNSSHSLQRTAEELRAMTEQLEERVAERTEQLRALASDLEAAEDRERRQIARDLHDDLGQTLAAARVRLAGLCSDAREDVRTPAQAVAELIDLANASTRTLAAQLAPAVLYELGLTPALEWLCEDIGRTFGLEASVHDDGRPKPLSQDARAILYRGVRELVINVAKHARTDTATIESSRIGDRIVIRVTDAGLGYDPAALALMPRRGLGLISVRERLSFIGGSLEVQSLPGHGTVSVLSVPLSSPTDA